MIVGLGVDAVEIERFREWPSYSQARLCKIYSTGELQYSLSEPVKAAERLAARFAAKEAAYKALNSYLPAGMDLMYFCQLVEVVKNAAGAPFLQIQAGRLGISEPKLHILLTLCHTGTTAIAVVLAELRPN